MKDKKHIISELDVSITSLSIIIDELDTAGKNPNVALILYEVRELDESLEVTADDITDNLENLVKHRAELSVKNLERLEDLKDLIAVFDLKDIVDPKISEDQYTTRWGVATEVLADLTNKEPEQSMKKTKKQKINLL